MSVYVARRTATDIDLTGQTIKAVRTAANVYGAVKYFAIRKTASRDINGGANGLRSFKLTSIFNIKCLPAANKDITRLRRVDYNWSKIYLRQCHSCKR